jgi:hypothetical protein
MADLNAGDRVVASGLKHTFLVAAAASSNLSATTTTITDIPGATATFNTVTAAANVVVWGVFDIATSVAAASVAVGHCSVDGVDQTAQALWQLVASARATVTQVWQAALSGSGSHTIKLRGALSAASGAAGFGSPHTTITVQVFDF